MYLSDPGGAVVHFRVVCSTGTYIRSPFAHDFRAIVGMRGLSQQSLPDTVGSLAASQTTKIRRFTVTPLTDYSPSWFQQKPFLLSIGGHGIGIDDPALPILTEAAAPFVRGKRRGPV